MFDNEIKKQWGFHPMQEAFFLTLRESNENLVPARVTFSSHDHYRILLLGMPDERVAKVRGHYYNEGIELPVVGDWIAAELLPGDHQYLPIFETLPRMTALKRSDTQRGYQTLLANVNTVCLVTSFNHDLNERRLERGLAMVEESGASALVIINKSDLIDERQSGSILIALQKRFAGVTVFACSAHNGVGIGEIRESFGVGHSVAFFGMSGVGKSTLINALLGEKKLETREIRNSDSRGRHTTTHRELVQTAHGFWLLDSPGIREFSVWAGEEDLDRAFDDISVFAAECRFGDCGHSVEPGCRIRKALETGEIAPDRWQNFLKMKREIEFQERKHDKAFRSQKNAEYAKRSIALRQRLKSKGKK